MTNSEIHKDFIEKFISIFKKDIDENSIGYNGSILSFVCKDNLAANVISFKDIFN